MDDICDFERIYEQVFRYSGSADRNCSPLLATSSVEDAGLSAIFVVGFFLLLSLGTCCANVLLEPPSSGQSLLCPHE